MKQKSKLQKWFLSALVGLALGGAATVAQAAAVQITYTVNTYDTAASIDGDWSWWGVCTPAWDGTQDCFGNSGSGSLYLYAQYGTSPTGGDNQQQIMIPEDFAHTGSWNNGTTIDATLYTNLEFYIKWKTNNVPGPSPDYNMDLSAFNNDGGGLEVMLVDTGWGNHTLGSYSLPTAVSNGWVKMDIAYNPGSQGIPNCTGVAFHKYNTSAQTNASYAIWIDNVQFMGSANPPPPPTMSIEPVTCEGLQFNNGASAGRYQRQMVRTVNSDFSWIAGHTGYPVSYNWHIANFSPGVPNWVDHNQFNTGIGSWTVWYGLGTLSFDPTVDAFTNTASGSLKAVVPFTGAGGEQFDYFMTFNDRWGYDWGLTLDGNAYSSLQFDIRVDPSSVPGSGGDFSTLEVGFVTGTGPNETAIGNFTIPGAATNGWVHANLGITPNNLYTPSYGLYLKDWVNGYLNSTLTFWIDNVVLYTASEQMHLFMVPQGTAYGNLPYGFVDSSVDWNCQTMLFLRIDQEYLWYNATNFSGSDPNYASYTCRFGYKTNEPGSENMIFNGTASPGNAAGLLCVLTDPQVVGDWSLTFANDTDFTISGPGGVTSSGSLPSASAAVFNDNMTLYFGSQPNSQYNVLQQGQQETLSHIQTIGLTDAIDDHFYAPPLNTAVWAVDAAAAGSVIWIVPTNAFWIIDWTVPDSGFSLETSPNLMSGWTTMANVTTIQPLHKLTVITNGETSVNSGFFRMIKRTPTQLQVLLPGEVNDPTQPSGKSGTPTPGIGVGNDYNVVVNMCDAGWNIVNSSDLVQVTSTGGADAGLVIAGGASLGGTANTLTAGTFTFTAVSVDGPAGTTVTATDLTNGGITPGISSIIPY